MGLNSLSIFKYRFTDHIQTVILHQLFQDRISFSTNSHNRHYFSQCLKTLHRIMWKSRSVFTKHTIQNYKGSAPAFGLSIYSGLLSRPLAFQTIKFRSICKDKNYSTGSRNTNRDEFICFYWN